MYIMHKLLLIIQLYKLIIITLLDQAVIAIYVSRERKELSTNLCCIFYFHSRDIATAISVRYSNCNK